MISTFKPIGQCALGK